MTRESGVRLRNHIGPFLAAAAAIGTLGTVLAIHAKAQDAGPAAS